MGNKIEAVVFDMDGVIFDTEAVWKQSVIESGKKFGVNITEEYRQTKLVGRKDIDVDKDLKTDFPDLDIVEFRKFMVSYVMDVITTSKNLLKPCFIELIKELKSRGIKIALATSSKSNRCEILFKNAGLDRDEIFDAVVTGGDVKNGKPNPEIFLTAMSKVNVKPENCVVLEDSSVGLQAAFASGAKPVMVVDLIMPNEELEKITTKIVYSLKEAMEFILSLND